MQQRQSNFGAKMKFILHSKGFVNFFYFCCISAMISLSKRFEPRSISSLCSVIVRVSVVLKRTVGDGD